MKNKLLISSGIAFVICLVLFGAWLMQVRTHLVASIKSAKKDTTSDVYYAATHSAVVIPAVITIPVQEDTVEPTPTPFALPTFAPMPTVAPITISVPSVISASTGCGGTPTAYNSEAMVSASSVLVGTSATITIELLDCNNTAAPVSDTLTVALSFGGDASTRINGSASPVTIQTQNGKATFSVTAQNPTVDTFVVTDSTRSFAVTDPSNHNPTVTFGNNTSGNASCTTAAGAPNGWYSDVYPNPPVSTDTSIQLIVDIRDCSQNLAPVSDTIAISVNSGNSDTQLNGGSLPQNVTTQNGEAKFTISSQTVGTVTLNVQDITSGFTVTNIKNANPSVTFNGSSSSPASTPTPTPTPGPTATPTPNQTPTDTPTPIPTGGITPTPT